MQDEAINYDTGIPIHYDDSEITEIEKPKKSKKTSKPRKSRSKKTKEIKNDFTSVPSDNEEPMFDMSNYEEVEQGFQEVNELDTQYESLKERAAMILINNPSVKLKDRRKNNDFHELEKMNIMDLASFIKEHNAVANKNSLDVVFYSLCKAASNIFVDSEETFKKMREDVALKDLVEDAVLNNIPFLSNGYKAAFKLVEYGIEFWAQLSAKNKNKKRKLEENGAEDNSAKTTV